MIITKWNNVDRILRNVLLLHFFSDFYERFRLSDFCLLLCFFFVGVVVACVCLFYQGILLRVALQTRCKFIISTKGGQFGFRLRNILPHVFDFVCIVCDLYIIFLSKNLFLKKMFLFFMMI